MPSPSRLISENWVSISTELTLQILADRLIETAGYRQHPPVGDAHLKLEAHGFAERRRLVVRVVCSVPCIRQAPMAGAEILYLDLALFDVALPESRTRPRRAWRRPRSAPPPQWRQPPTSTRGAAASAEASDSVAKSAPQECLAYKSCVSLANFTRVVNGNNDCQVMTPRDANMKNT